MKISVRQKLLILFLFGILAFDALAQNSNSTSNAWPLFRGNPQNTGVATGTLPENPEVLWTFPANDAIESTAAIYDGIVYFGSLDGNLYAVDFDTGDLLWNYQAANEIKSSPSVYKNRVYFGDGSGTFHAVDARSGKKAWTFQAGAEIISSANFYEERVLFGAYDNFLYCLSAENGKLRWKVETEGYVHGTPAILDERVFITGCDGYFRGINIPDGIEEQKIELGDYVAGSPAILDGRAYFGTFGNQVFCVDLHSDSIAWRYEHPQRKFPYYASAAVTKNLVMVGGRDKMLHALDPMTGEARWTFTTKSKIESSPIIVGEEVIAISSNGTIYILNIHSGKPTWQYDTGASTVASASFAEGKFVIGSDDGVLYCFGRK